MCGGLRSVLRLSGSPVLVFCINSNGNKKEPRGGNVVKMSPRESGTPRRSSGPVPRRDTGAGGRLQLFDLGSSPSMPI